MFLFQRVVQCAFQPVSDVVVTHKKAGFKQFLVSFKNGRRGIIIILIRQFRMAGFLDLFDRDFPIRRVLREELVKSPERSRALAAVFQIEHGQCFHMGHLRGFPHYIGTAPGRQPQKYCGSERSVLKFSLLIPVCSAKMEAFRKRRNTADCPIGQPGNRSECDVRKATGRKKNK